MRPVPSSRGIRLHLGPFGTQHVPVLGVDEVVERAAEQLFGCLAWVDVEEMAHRRVRERDHEIGVEADECNRGREQEGGYEVGADHRVRASGRLMRPTNSCIDRPGGLL